MRLNYKSTARSSSPVVILRCGGHYLLPVLALLLGKRGYFRPCNDGGAIIGVHGMSFFPISRLPPLGLEEPYLPGSGASRPAPIWRHSKLTSKRACLEDALSVHLSWMCHQLRGGASPSATATSSRPSSTPTSKAASKATAKSAQAAATSASAAALAALQSKTSSALPQTIQQTLLSESALMDKETNRIYWQGGSLDIFSTSLSTPYLTRRGVLHVKATFLTVALWLWLWGRISRFITTSYFEPAKGLSPPLLPLLPQFLSSKDSPLFLLLSKIATLLSPFIQFILLILRALLYFRLPPYSPRILALTVLSYLFESYTCSTRRYLSHAMNAPAEVQNYLERLREAQPRVEWKVRCFHYEEREWWLNIAKILSCFPRGENSSGSSSCAFVSARGKRGGVLSNQGSISSSSSATTDEVAGPSVALFPGAKKGSSAKNSNNLQQSNPMSHDKGNKSKSSNHSDRASAFFSESPPLWRAKKVITHQAVGSYKFESWEDNTIASLWKRSQSFSSSSTVAPFTKLSLSKLLVLKDKKAREEYFAQQAAFVMLEGRKDVYAEFATNIEVDGFRSKLLAVRPVNKVPSAAIFRLYIYYLFTLLGLSLPYRIWFGKHCDELRVTVVKETSSDVSTEDEEGNGNGGWGWGWGIRNSSGGGGGNNNGGIGKDWFRGKFGLGTSSSSSALAMERKRAKELFRKSMQGFSLYEDEPSSFDSNIGSGVRNKEESTAVDGGDVLNVHGNTGHGNNVSFGSQGEVHVIPTRAEERDISSVHDNQMMSSASFQNVSEVSMGNENHDFVDNGSGNEIGSGIKLISTPPLQDRSMGGNDNGNNEDNTDPLSKS